MTDIILFLLIGAILSIGKLLHLHHDPLQNHIDPIGTRCALAFDRGGAVFAIRARRSSGGGIRD